MEEVIEYLKARIEFLEGHIKFLETQLSPRVDIAGIPRTKSDKTFSPIHTMLPPSARRKQLERQSLARLHVKEIPDG